MANMCKVMVYFSEIFHLEYGGSESSGIRKRAMVKNKGASWM